MHGDHGLSPTHEMYLKVLYRLQAENDVGRVRDMAKGLGVTTGTVSSVLKKLERAGLVLHDRYGTVKLTPAGARVAECVIRRFEIIRAFLTEVLGMDAETADDDACTMEHAMGPATINRLESFLTWFRQASLTMPRFSELDRSSSTCTDCAASGSCQAIVAIGVPPSAAERN